MIRILCLAIATACVICATPLEVGAQEKPGFWQRLRAPLESWPKWPFKIRNPFARKQPEPRFDTSRSPSPGVAGFDGTRGMAAPAGRAQVGSRGLSRSDGSLTRSHSLTTPNGETFSREHTITRTDDGIQQTSAWTGPDGRAVTRSGSIVRDGDSLTRSHAITTPSGHAFSRESTLSRTDDGLERTSQFEHTYPNGRTSSRSAGVDHDADSIRRYPTFTRPNGRTLSRETTHSPAGGSYDATRRRSGFESPDQPHRERFGGSLNPVVPSRGWERPAGISTLGNDSFQRGSSAGNLGSRPPIGGRAARRR